MKVIDLLNKIANGEEVPKKIRYGSANYKYDVYDYFQEDKDNGDAPLSYWIDFDKKDLNDEVEIIEDTPKKDKKIKKIGKDKIYNNSIVENEFILQTKIDEIIDRLNGEDNEDK